MRASKLAELSEIPAFVDDAADSYDQVIENEQRKGLTPLELALFVQRRLTAGDSQAEIARRMGKSRQFVTMATALIDAPDWLMAAYREGRCRGLNELYELRKLAGSDPQAVEAWTSDREAITRDRVMSLRANLASRSSSVRAGASALIQADAASGDASTRPSPPASAAAKRPSSDVTFTSRTLLVIDEAGMLDTPSLHTLLGLLPEGARLLLAGDEGQLPPVGIGKVFHDLVAEGSRVARLTKVLRQAADSDIPKVSLLVRQGCVPQLDAWNGEAKGAFLVPLAQRDAVQRRLRAQGELMLVAAKRATVADINDTESFASRPAGAPTRRLGPLATVAVADPVVSTANRYQDGLFNGLLGVVVSIDGSSIEVLWDGEDKPRSLPTEAEGDVELAYAITCHKAQGSSAHAVVVVVEDSRLVTREWLYTAITRGKDLVLLVGDEEALSAAVTRRTARTTGFSLPTLWGEIARHEGL